MRFGLNQLSLQVGGNLQIQEVTGQLADTPTRGLPTHGLDDSRTGHLADWSTQLNSTELNEHLWTQVLKHLNVHIYLDTISYRYYNQLISRTDLSLIPVSSAAKSYITSWCIQNLSKRVLNRQTVSTSTTKLGRLFQILTIRAEKEYLRVS